MADHSYYSMNLRERVSWRHEVHLIAEAHGSKETYVRRIQPLLSGVKVPVLSVALGISDPYAAEIRAGRYLPHPRHCVTLARLVGFSEPSG